ncbi:hypothetical protein [Fluviicola taffensis]|uniref:Lipoprotein n=1 Tax=Fluviicola taffensis (strain DSM 16823 / NCIMB 13979 / RW262) TaxID=755732 RepID=F2IIZ1_FLUTR|nr:hypothetical protein [Fluviicola taffensis]AEA43849.1 hypothetical protein Fluta_1862 [Fluviicola taffensis DSM 16823]
MKRIFSLALLAISLLTTISSCKKENARKPYLFRLEFDSGDVWEEECYLFEKHKQNKRYKNSGVEKVVDLKHSKDAIYTDVLKGETVLYKVNGRTLIGVSNVIMSVSNFAILNHQSGLMLGKIELEGSYKQEFRKYTVENGKFEFQLQGGLFSLPDTILKGKWTMKRL